MENKVNSKNVTERIERNGTKQKSIIKFDRILKENVCQISQLKQKKWQYDPQSMKEMIHSLKEQNGELKQVIRVQQTQLHYFREQEKNMINTVNFDNDKQKIMHKNIILRQKMQKLSEQCERIKKSCKYSSMKELEIANQQYLEQIKNLTAKLKSTSKKSGVIQLNEIIEKEYFTSLKNKELQKKIAEKDCQIQRCEKHIIKLKNMNNARNRQMEVLKEHLDELNRETKKIRNLEDYVHKNELIAKKKQLLTMSETIENLQIKLLQCQNKAQTLQQQNIDNMNREVSKKKEMIAAYQALKQKCSQLQGLLLKNTQLTESNIQNIRLDKISPQSQFINKLKIPLTVSPTDLTPTIKQIVFNLQTHGIQKNVGIDLLLGRIFWEKILGVNGSAQDEDSELDEDPEEQTSSVNIHQIIRILDSSPFNIQNYDQKQLFARYCTEDTSQDSQFIQFTSKVNIEYARSILKQLIPQYYLFNQEQTIDLCSEVSKYLTTHESGLKEALKHFQIDRRLEISLSNSMMDRRRIYSCDSIISCIRKEADLSQYTMSFVEFRTFPMKDQCIEFMDFVRIFKVGEEEELRKQEENGGFCVFLTQRNKSELVNDEFYSQMNCSALSENKEGTENNAPR